MSNPVAPIMAAICRDIKRIHRLSCDPFRSQYEMDPPELAHRECLGDTMSVLHDLGKAQEYLEAAQKHLEAIKEEDPKTYSKIIRMPDLVRMQGSVTIINTSNILGQLISNIDYYASELEKDLED